MNEKPLTMANDMSQEDQEQLRKVRDCFLICCVKRAGGRLEFPVTEVDAADDLLIMSVEGDKLILQTEFRS